MSLNPIDPNKVPLVLTLNLLDPSQGAPGPDFEPSLTPHKVPLVVTLNPLDLTKVPQHLPLSL